jgi:hypothetical protein
MIACMNSGVCRQHAEGDAAANKSRHAARQRLDGGDGADTFVYTGLLDGHDLIEGFTSEDRLDLTKLSGNLGVAASDREGRVSLTDNGFGDVNVAVDADGNTANGFEHIVATIHTNSPITVGHEVVVNG